MARVLVEVITQAGFVIAAPDVPCGARLGH